MSRLIKIVEIKISKILPDTFSIVFDSWTMRDSHFNSVYAMFPEITEKWFQTSTMKQSKMLTNNRNFWYFVLGTFSQSLSNVAALIGENCSTNLSLAAMCKVPFIGCALHRSIWLWMSLPKLIKDSLAIACCYEKTSLLCLSSQVAPFHTIQGTNQQWNTLVFCVFNARTLLSIGWVFAKACN